MHVRLKFLYVILPCFLFGFKRCQTTTTVDERIKIPITELLLLLEPQTCPSSYYLFTFHRKAVQLDFDSHTIWYQKKCWQCKNYINNTTLEPNYVR